MNSNALKLSLGVTDQWSSGKVAIFTYSNLYFFLRVRIPEFFFFFLFLTPSVGSLNYLAL